MNSITRISTISALLLLSFFNASSAQAARNSSRNSSPDYSSSYSSTGSGTMLMDITALYSRDTRADGASDMAMKLSVGGMFSEHVGLDLQGTHEAKSKSYLVGADLRVSPVQWFFLKAGIGGYTRKESKQFQLVPIGAMGILAPVTESFYLTSELGYFQASGRHHANFGGGLGVRF